MSLEIDVNEQPEGQLWTVRGSLTHAHGRVLSRMSKRRPGPVTLDLSEVQGVDAGGVAWLVSLRERQLRAQQPFSVRAASPQVHEALGMFGVLPEGAPPAESKGSPAHRLDAALTSLWGGLVEWMSFVADAAFCLWRVSPRTRRVLPGVLAKELMVIGVAALPIVALIALLIGVVVALQSAQQLRQFGANIYVADLIAVGVTREMGPLITAIVVAGRSGAAIAAQIGTMQVSEEVDALRVMGLDAAQYTVIPKLRAMLLALPLLTTYANVVAILGGCAVAVSYLDLGPDIYFRQVWRALAVKDVLLGVAKSAAFAAIIVLTAARAGLMARGGAEAVGQATTRSVVRSIFWVIVADAAFSLLFYFA